MYSSFQVWTITALIELICRFVIVSNFIYLLIIFYRIKPAELLGIYYYYIKKAPPGSIKVNKKETKTKKELPKE